MLAAQLVNDHIPPLLPTDTVDRALHWMADFKVSHLPVVQDAVVLGVISEAVLLDAPNANAPLISLDDKYLHPTVSSHQHIYDVINKIAEENLSVVPVIGRNQEYIGLISAQHLIHFFANIITIDRSGSIIVLEMGVRDFALSEIARLVETNDARILSSYITSQPGNNTLELTLKIDVADLSRIIATLQRFNYNITAYYHAADAIDLSNERYDGLMNYLSV